MHAFSNLVSNSLKYAGKTATIKIVLDSESVDEYQIYFTDNGPGISSEYKDEIFEKFFRLPNSASGGLGLGLAIVKSIIELHQGSIELSDKFKGACFKITLPRKKIPASIHELVSEHE
jgi:two-component system sensor histidine kinase KdpD